MNSIGLRTQANHVVLLLALALPIITAQAIPAQDVESSLLASSITIAPGERGVCSR